MGDFFYEPTCLQASNGDTVEVVNDGDAPHTYTVDGTDLVNLEPHDSGRFTVEGLSAGTVYEVTCIYHSNMTAALKAV
jgi:plastocyanin